MTSNQAKAISEVMRLLSVGAGRGRRMVEEGKTIHEVLGHAKALQQLSTSLVESCEKAIGAEHILGLAARRTG